MIRPLDAQVVRDTMPAWLTWVPAPAPIGRVRRWLAGRATPERVVVALATVLCIGFYAWYTQRGLTLAYADAISHLMIARRVVAARTPGLGQLGGDWLPLPHLLMLPLIWIPEFWRDGFAGALPSMVAYVIGSLYMYRLGSRLVASQAAGLTAALAYMLNPSMLYMQATAMTEVSLTGAIVVAIYYAVCWAQTHRAAELVKTAAAVATATAVRYDGWAVAATVVLIVIGVAWRHGGRIYAEANALLFGVLGFAGCMAWMLYNQVIFGNALKFFNGSTSAQGQFKRDVKTLETYHNPLLSLHIYSQASLDMFWWPLVALALLGLVWWMVRHRLDIQTLPVYAILAPFVFNWASMVYGISGIRTPEIALGGYRTYFNERLVLVMMPAVALFLAFLASRHRLLAITVSALILLFVGFGSFQGTPYVLQDPLHGLSHDGFVRDPQGGKWLARHYRGGNVLTSGAPFEPLMFYSKLPDHIFITDADAVEFPAALAQPQRHVTWIMMASRSANDDVVWDSLSRRRDWRRYFVLRHVIGTAQFYERAGGS